MGSTSVALGVKTSGDYGMSLILLKHFGLDEQQSIKAEYAKYPKIEEEFQADDLDAAFITMGIREPIFPGLFEAEKCDLLSIPYRDSLTKKHLSMSTYEIPEGHYCFQPSARPGTEIRTVAVNALLATAPADKALPALKPNQPNHKRPAPKTANGRL